MKKIAIFFIIIIMLIVIVIDKYTTYIDEYKVLQQENSVYESYLGQTTKGSDVASLINKVIDSNIKNDVKVDLEGIHENNNLNSINIDIIFSESDNTYNMEKIYNAGMTDFISYYGETEFKCVELQYHEQTGKVRYLLFIEN